MVTQIYFVHSVVQIFTEISIRTDYINMYSIKYCIIIAAEYYIILTMHYNVNQKEKNRFSNTPIPITKATYH